MDKQDQVILGLESSSRTTSDYIQALREGMLKLTHNTGLTAFNNVQMSQCLSL